MMDKIKNVDKLIPILSATFLCLVFCGQMHAQNSREIWSINDNWLFHAGDVTNGFTTNFDDGSWRKLNVPHDWSIEGKYDAQNPSGCEEGFLPTGVVWYRKHISVPASEQGRRFVLSFGGIMENGEVWVNGKYFGLHPYGYTATTYDISDVIHIGSDNIIAVKANTTSQPASRWYTGTGIYRPVSLIITSPIHLDHWGVFYNPNVISKQKADIDIEAVVTNQGKRPAKLTMTTTLTTPNGKKTFRSKPLEFSLSAGEETNLKGKVEVTDPIIWDIDNPQLYQAKTELQLDGKTIDDRIQYIGIRTCRWDAESGFWLNGRNLKIKGLCFHHDGGAVGAAVPMSVWERRLQHLKEIGGNAIRCAHNPQSDEFYSLCDRMGILVMMENFDCWTVAKNPYDYARVFKDWYERDLTTMVKMDRNHPSIIIRSMGNEIHDKLGDSTTCVYFNTMKKIVKEFDPSRPVTQAVFRPNVYGVYQNGYSELMDVVGQNYRENELAAAHEQKPSRIVIGTENRPESQAWLYLRDKPYMCGQFLWAGCDYLGESKGWPNIGYDIAPFDRNGGYKPLAFEIKSWWSTEPMVQIVRKEDNAGAGALVCDWTPSAPESYKQAEVLVYSNCDEVELFLNGTSLGKQTQQSDCTPLKWNVNFNKGEIRAMGYNKGQMVAEQHYITAGEAQRIIVRAERSTIHHKWDDVVYVNATVTDADGICQPNGVHALTFTVTGPGEIVATDNADVSNHEGYCGNKKSSYKGEGLAIIRATNDKGRIVVHVSSNGLKSNQAVINIQ
jgi:beta-galactosidase